MRIALSRFCGESDVALGAVLGERHFARIIELLPAETDAGQTLLFDFEGVAATNGSYLKAVVLRLLMCGRLTVETNPIQFSADIRPLNIFPVLAGLSAAVRLEAAEFFVARALPVLVLASPKRDLESDGTVTEAVVEGRLDSSLRQTLDAVVELGEITAPKLHERFPNSGILATAWNNRLTELCALRLLRRRRRGRSWLYQSITKRIAYGSGIS